MARNCTELTQLLKHEFGACPRILARNQRSKSKEFGRGVGNNMMSITF
jgi:hypothetical protein